MGRRIAAALLGSTLPLATPAYADDCTRLFGGQSPRDDKGWDYALWDFATDIQKSKVRPDLITVAAGRLDAQIAAFDPIKPGRLSDVAGTIANLEAGTLGLQLCDASLANNAAEPILPLARISAWRRAIRAAADQFLTVFGDAWEEEAMRPGTGRFVQRDAFGSATMRAAIAAKRPALWPRLQAAVMATPEGGSLQAQYDTRAQLERRRSVREVAGNSLPAVVNGWRKTGTHTYTRRAGPVTATLLCSTGFGGAGGLNLQLDLAGGAFVSENRLKGVQSTPVHLRIAGTDRTVVGRLASTGSSDSTTLEIDRKVVTTTTYYDTSTVVVSINSPTMLAQQLRNANDFAMRFSGRVTKAMFGIEVPDDENAVKILMDLYSDMAGKALEANPPWNLDIAEVRALPTLPMSVDSDSFGRLPLFDLAPARPPFKSLMDACWG